MNPETVTLAIEPKRAGPEAGAPQGPTLSRKSLGSAFDFGIAVSPRSSLLLGLAAWIAFFAVWELSIATGLSQETLLPHVHQVFAAFGEMFFERGFAGDIAASVQRIAISFGLVCVVAVPLGILMGAFTPVDSFFTSFVATWRYLPAASFVPLLLMWLGAGEGQKLALLFLGSVWFLLTLVADHTKAVRREFVETSLTLGGSRLQVLRTVIVPAALPNIFIAMRQMLAIGWTYLVIAEIVATTDGIGAAMMRAKRFLHVDEIMAGIITIGVLGLISDLLFRRISWWLFPYKNRREL